MIQFSDEIPKIKIWGSKEIKGKDKQANQLVLNVVAFSSDYPKDFWPWHDDPRYLEDNLASTFKMIVLNFVSIGFTS